MTRGELLRSVCVQCGKNAPEDHRAFCRYCREERARIRRERRQQLDADEGERPMEDRKRRSDPAIPQPIHRGPGVFRMAKRRSVQARMIREAKGRNGA